MIVGTVPVMRMDCIDGDEEVTPPPGQLQGLFRNLFCYSTVIDVARITPVDSARNRFRNRFRTSR
jgi:hypothetical protein